MKNRIIKGTYGSSFYNNKEVVENEFIVTNKVNDLFGRVPDTVPETVATPKPIGRVIIGKASQNNPENRVHDTLDY